jgi:hypothetical protein
LGSSGSLADCRSKHDLVAAQCSGCRPGRGGLPARVAITSGGSVFHTVEQCEALHMGWRQVSRRGGSISDLRWVPITNALTEGRGGCEVCCAHLNLEP